MQQGHRGPRVASGTQDKQSISDEALELKVSRSSCNLEKVGHCGEDPVITET